MKIFLPAILVGYWLLGTSARLDAQEVIREPRATLKTGVAAHVFAVSPDGKTLAIGGGRSTSWFSLWDLTTGKVVGGGGADFSGAVEFMAFSPDGKTLASSDGVVVILYDVTKHKDIRTLPHSEPRYFNSLAFSPDGKTLATAVEVRAEKESKIVAGEVMLWDIATGRNVTTYKGFPSRVESLSFAADGKTLVTMDGAGYDSKVKLWDVPASRIPD